MIICVCNRIGDSQLAKIMHKGKPLDYPGALAELGHGVVCGACREEIEQLLIKNGVKKEEEDPSKS